MFKKNDRVRLSKDTRLPTILRLNLLGVSREDEGRVLESKGNMVIVEFCSHIDRSHIRFNKACCPKRELQIIKE